METSLESLIRSDSRDGHIQIKKYPLHGTRHAGIGLGALVLLHSFPEGTSDALAVVPCNSVPINIISLSSEGSGAKFTGVVNLLLLRGHGLEEAKGLGDIEAPGVRKAADRAAERPGLATCEHPVLSTQWIFGM